MAERTLNPLIPEKELDAVIGGLLKAPRDKVDSAVAKPLRRRKAVTQAKKGRPKKNQRR